MPDPIVVPVPLASSGAVRRSHSPLAWVVLLGAACGSPPHVEMDEAYAGDAAAAATVFDHSVLDGLLRRHVHPGGLVDYEALAAEAPARERYLDALADADFAPLPRDEKLAFLINAYNAFTLRLILDHRPVESIRDIPESERWTARRWRLCGETVSLDEIEHQRIRPKFAEPRIHFAVVCAAMGCPPLRAEAYTGVRLEEQLREQTEQVHSQPRWFVHRPSAGVVELTRLYDWYGDDFAQAAGSVLAFVARHAPAVRAALERGEPLRIEWLPYDWSLNAVHR